MLLSLIFAEVNIPISNTLSEKFSMLITGAWFIWFNCRTHIKYSYIVCVFS